ncbi:hypothetical protein D3C71_1696170 [compost metagenome]
MRMVVLRVEIPIRFAEVALPPMAYTWLPKRVRWARKMPITTTPNISRPIALRRPPPGIFHARLESVS